MMMIMTAYSAITVRVVLIHPNAALSNLLLPTKLTSSRTPADGRRSLISLCSSNIRWRFRGTTTMTSMSRAGEFTHPIEVVKGEEEEEEEEEEDMGISRAALIWRAVKLPIYTVALIPLTVGSSAAYLQTGLFNFRRFSCLLLSSICVIAWLNLSNDVFDSETGVDKKKKESVVNIVGSRGGTFYAANAFLLVGVLGLLCACLEGGDLRSIILLVAAIFCGYVYQCPRFRLSYKGLGEPLCFLSFGPLSTIAFYLSQCDISATGQLPFTGTIYSASVLVGMTTALILFCSHFHQIDEDRAVGKMSPLVRLGTKKGSILVKRVVILLYSLLLAMVAMKTLPFTCLLSCILTLPISKMVVDYVDQNHDKKGKIFMAKYYCVRLHSVFGAALSAGFVAAAATRMS